MVDGQGPRAQFVSKRPGELLEICGPVRLILGDDQAAAEEDLIRKWHGAARYRPVIIRWTRVALSASLYP